MIKTADESLKIKTKRPSKGVRLNTVKFHLEGYKMSIEKISKILNQHSVPFKILNGRIYADSMQAGTKLFEAVEDLTDSSPENLYEWLGY